ncbi:Hsp70 family protein [Microbispora hainanensis]|uniref:Hsp70 family protein n=1 Tax=Microbispora hainanensis TaxID=568844 RepID=A0ABZ1SHE9_9ACTN|nr:Hsp70 family protein [Microbispora hainanensis]
MSDWSLAIDFGTCFTCAAIRVGEQVEVLETDSGRYTPSLVYRDESGELLTGRRAASQAETFPARVARVPKRELVNRSPVLLGGAVVDAEDLAAAVLSTMAGEALRRSGGVPPQEVVLTHPAAWTSDDIAALGEAAKRAHLPSARFVPEPVAAAAFYTQREDIPAGAHVAVYDLGGGTFDVAVLRRTTTGFDVIAQGGNDRIGGEDFDEALHELVAGHATTLDPAAWQDFTQATGLRATRDRALLRRDITEAKELLSVELTRTVIVGDHAIRITRDELNQAIEADIRETITEFQRVLTEAGLTPRHLTAVYLTGGSSRIPLVSDLLSHHLGRTPDLAADPKAVVTLGALTRPRKPRPSEDHEESRTDPPHRSKPKPVSAMSHRATLVGHAKGVDAVRFSPDGTILATASYDETARLWDIRNPDRPHLLTILNGHGVSFRHIAFSPDGTTFATTGREATARLWDIRNPDRPHLLTTLRAHTDWIEGVTFSPDGTILATASNDGTARLWDISNLHQPQPLSILKGHHNWVWWVVFSPDGTTLATAGYPSGTVGLWDVRDPSQPVPLNTLDGHRSSVTGVAFSPDGATLATTSSAIRLWDLRDPSQPMPLNTLKRHHSWVAGGFNPGGGPRGGGVRNSISHVVFSPDGTTLAIANNDGTARLWDIHNLDQPLPTIVLKGHTGPVHDVAFSPDGVTLATASDDKTARLWVAAGHG